MKVIFRSKDFASVEGSGFGFNNRRWQPPGIIKGEYSTVIGRGRMSVSGKKQADQVYRSLCGRRTGMPGYLGWPQR
ncbi:hypothetical protein KSF_009110 [Reticulibacter mediterranei]|uniref:Uncharacterized protein n=1 Tax=Reticulibacter mediterranei TaxID=2778369 RepID=A0A8J3MZW3_9CHLR|nr:hypothetical protein [Reticulibacter mediterranei]GHO90863.1 hypothetical protein KSF_009110 [Reticulibacter mediterranei]